MTIKRTLDAGHRESFYLLRGISSGSKTTEHSNSYGNTFAFGIKMAIGAVNSGTLASDHLVAGFEELDKKNETKNYIHLRHCERHRYRY